MTDIEENILLYCDTAIRTAGSGIQVPLQKICEHVTFSLKYKWCPIMRQYVFHDVSYTFYTFSAHGKHKHFYFL